MITKELDILFERIYNECNSKKFQEGLNNEFEYWAVFELSIKGEETPEIIENQLMKKNGQPSGFKIYKDKENAKKAA